MPEATGYHAHVYFGADTIQRASRICTACGTNSARLWAFARATGRPASRLELPTRLRTGKARGRGRFARAQPGRACRARRPGDK